MCHVCACLQVSSSRDLFSTLLNVDEAALPKRATSGSGCVSTEGLPAELHVLADAQVQPSLPEPGTIDSSLLDNWKLDKLVAALGRSRTTWRRALMLYDWLRASNHSLDDRLCTTVSAHPVVNVFTLGLPFADVHMF